MAECSIGNSCEQQTNEECCTRLKSIQQQHQQFQLSFLERKQSLLFHYEMLTELCNGPFLQENKGFVECMLSASDEIQSVFSSQLIRSQIHAEEETQYRLLLKEYECRITQLRNNLIDKEIQVAIESGVKKKHFYPNRENFKQWNVNFQEELHLKNTLRDHHLLKKEVATLQRVYEDKVNYQLKQQKNRKSMSSTRDISSHSTNPRRSVDNARGLTARSFNGYNSMANDKLMKKVYHCLKNEMFRHLRLKRQEDELQEELKKAASQHKELTELYKDMIQTKKEKKLEEQDEGFLKEQPSTAILPDLKQSLMQPLKDIEKQLQKLTQETITEPKDSKYENWRFIREKREKKKICRSLGKVTHGSLSLEQQIDYA